MNTVKLSLMLVGSLILGGNNLVARTSMSTRDAARLTKQVALVGYTFNDFAGAVHTALGATDELHKGTEDNPSFQLRDVPCPKINNDVQETCKHVYNILKSALGEEDAAATLVTWAKVVYVPLQVHGWDKESAKRIAVDLVFEVLKEASKRGTKPLVDTVLAGQTNVALTKTVKVSTKLATQAVLAALKVLVEELIVKKGGGLIAKDCKWNQIEEGHTVERWAKSLVEPVVTSVAYEVLGDAVRKAIEAADAHAHLEVPTVS